MKNTQYIISEYYQLAADRKLILEAERENRPVILSGVLQKANTLNRNGRIYPYNILKREAATYMDSVEDGTAGGELDHPDSAVVSLGNVSHRVIDMWWQGEELFGKVQIAETKAGDTLKGLLKSGFKLGISSRGVGSVNTVRGEDIVQDDFELIAFDFVSSPSTPGAFLFKEGVEKWGLTLFNSKKQNEFIEYQLNKNTKLKELLNDKFWKNL